MCSASWNPKVGHIVCTSTASGRVVVWDIRQKTVWCELFDNNTNRVSQVAWNPHDGLQLLTGFSFVLVVTFSDRFGRVSLAEAVGSSEQHFLPAGGNRRTFEGRAGLGVERRGSSLCGVDGPR